MKPWARCQNHRHRQRLPRPESGATQAVVMGRSSVLSVPDIPVDGLVGIRTPVSIAESSAPLAPVPQTKPGDWLREPDPEPVLAPPAPPRFLSQRDPEEEQNEAVEPHETRGAVIEPAYNSSSSAAVTFEPTVPEPVEPVRNYQVEEPEPVIPAYRPKFAELAEEPAYIRREEYAPRYQREDHSQAEPEAQPADPAPIPYRETNEATQPDPGQANLSAAAWLLS